KVVAGGGAFNLYTGFDSALARYDGGPLNVVSQQQVSGQLQAVAQAIAAQPSQSAAITFLAATGAQVSSTVAAINALPPIVTGGTVTVNLDLGCTTIATDTQVNAPAGVTVRIVNGTLVGG